MHKVKNVIILAAGRGSRLEHLTNNVPKPLLSPNGTPFIEGIIKNLNDKGINDIVVVTGYKSEKFDYLANRVTLIKNEEWENGNNVTSIKAAINFIGDSIIVNGDVIMKSNVFRTEYESSLTYVEKNENIDEWIVETNSDGQVINFDKNGLGKSGLYQREIIFVTEELGNSIKLDINNFDMNEYQEYLMIQSANRNNISFKTLEIDKNTVFDLDTVDEFISYAG